MKHSSKWLIEKLKSEKIIYSDSLSLDYSQLSFLTSFSNIAFTYGILNYIPDYNCDYDYYPSNSIVVKLDDIFFRITSIVREKTLIVYNLIEATEYYADFFDILDNKVSERINEFKLAKFKDKIIQYIEDYDLTEDEYRKVSKLIYRKEEAN